MKGKGIQQTVLAMMVGAVATQVSAVDTDITTGQNSWAGENLSQPLTLTGSRSVVAQNPFTYGVTFGDTNIQGSLVNRADISMSGNARAVGAFAVDGAFTPGGMPVGGTITGDIIQAGTLTMTGLPDAEGFEVGGTTVGGSIINSGKIIIDSTGQPFGAGEGIYINGTTIGGDLSNTGLVDVTGDEGTGLILDRHNNLSVIIGGKLLNSGTIRVSGEEAVGMDLEAPTSDLSIENSGLISANGNHATAVQVYEGSIDYLLNTGTIEAKGSDATAFNLRGADFTANLPSGARGLINRGTISAGGTAILVTPQEQLTAFEINQQAGEIRSESGTAIDGAGLASLNWTGGKITGNILNTTAVNIAGQADFVGNRIASPVSINAGSLNLSAPGTTLVGDLNVASGAGIDMRLSNAYLPSATYLTVSGTANFALGSRLTVNAKPGDFSAPSGGTEYTLLSASSLKNHGLTVTSNSSLLDVLGYSADAQTVKAVVAVKSDQQVQQDLSSAGASRSAITALNELKNHVLGQLSPNDPLFKASAGSGQALAQLAEQLKPDVSRGALDVALSGQTVINGAIFNRLTGQRENREAAGVWVQGLSSNMDQDGRDGDNGYSANSSGVAVGADGRWSDTTTLGVAYSYLNSTIHSDLGNKTEVQGNALSLYGNWSLQNWFVDGSLSYGHNDNDSKRHVAGTTAKGSYGSDVLSASVLGGYTFRLSDAVSIEPRVAARYSSVRMDGFNEKGSSAALSTGSQRYEVGELGAGLRLAGNLPLSTGSLQPEATLMAYHDLMGDRVAQTSSFVLGGSAFTVTGASVARDSYEASVGLNYQVSALTVGASYTRQARSGFDADGVMLKARYAF
ncbi:MULTISPECIES: autotransporter outer membrane beta-barrel domain-containing protein [unclassified Pseudomonas]|uniref:autotransporter family protein n=1 Tax=unclassified Pseudomonas TaxID=196821 RepID=UPI0015A2EE81|nr:MULTISPECIES: autotransporter outer membrane beta-barrel domain-containing protein [unclassified Pseudomonas]NWC94176.1 autotransporter domain-containing protein [Pseudomonas sp. IPO3779]NWD20858.1 autotransporter domain-containing protein [Pseudomonas sp. IPO3778]